MLPAENMIDKMVKHESCGGPILCHYCKKDSLSYLLKYGADISARSILKSPNDKNEYRVGVDVFCAYLLKNRIVSTHVVDRIKGVLEYNICAGDKEKSCAIPFAFCLTEAFNSPYHWQEFAGDAGFCVLFSSENLRAVCDMVVRQGRASLELLRCYYVGYDDFAIDSVCEAICRDRRDDLVSLERSLGLDADAGKRLVAQVCMFAMRVKCARYYPEREWRVAMIARNAHEATSEGYLSTGIRNCCYRNDVMSIMRGVISSPTGSQAQLQEHLCQLLNTRIGK